MDLESTLRFTSLVTSLYLAHPSILHIRLSSCSCLRMFLFTSSPSLIFPLLLSNSARCSILVETSSFHLPLSATRLPISVQSSPASFISFLQYLTVFLFLPLVFSHSSNSSSQPSGDTLVVLHSPIIMMCPILPHTLFTTFHLTVLIFTSFRMSCMLTPFLFISLSGDIYLNLRHLSELLQFLQILRIPHSRSTFKQKSALYTCLVQSGLHLLRH